MNGDTAAVPDRSPPATTAAAVAGDQIQQGTPAFRRTAAALFLAGFSTFGLLYTVQPLLPEFSRHFGVSAANSALTLSLSKPLDHGFSGSFSATFSHAKEVSTGSSSQAWSNYNYMARANPNEMFATTSAFDVPLSTKLSLNWDHAFFGDYRTTVSLFYNGHSGRPYSWVFGNDVNGDNLSNVGAGGDLAYIPLVNDPLVDYGTATQDQIDAFNAFIDNDPYLSKHRGEIAGRNRAREPWVNQLDLGLQQEFPGFMKGHKSIVRLDIYNFLNLLNSDWGVTNRVSSGFYENRRLVTVGGVQNGQYVYNLGAPGTVPWENYAVYDASGTNPSRVVSRWSVLMTLRYTF
jgi:hypothetical protein